MQMAVRPFGSLQLSSVASSSYGHIRYQRNALEIRKDSIDNFSFLFVSRGEIGAAQQQREASVEPGDMMMYHQASPFTLNASTGGVRAIIVSIPPALLTARVPDAHKLTARRLRNEPGRLAGKMFRQLIQSDIPSDSATAKRLGSAALDVLATALETEMEGPQPQATRQLDAVKQFIRDNLHDPSLDAERIAIANNIAPRTLKPIVCGRRQHTDSLALATAAGGELRRDRRGTCQSGRRRRHELRIQRPVAFQPRVQKILRMFAAIAEGQTSPQPLIERWAAVT
jgi:AraC-binding-like domain